jgi:glycosyltransferase involved in cell wall biosynthesis
MKRKISRLLWISGIPAWYTRELHKQFDINGYAITYLYVKDKDEYTKQREYEEGDFSKNAIFYQKVNHKVIVQKIMNFAQDPDAGILFCGIYPYFLLKTFYKIHNCPCKKIYWSDSNIASLQFPFLKSLYYRWVLSRCDTLMCMGTTNALFYRNIIGQKRFSDKQVLHVPLPAKRIANSLLYKDHLRQDNCLRFLFMGRLESEKNLISLIESCILLLKRDIKKFELWIAGSGSQETLLINSVKKNGLEGNVRFLGSIKSSSIMDIYQQCDVLLLVSKRDAWGLVVNEALVAGLPVILPVWIGAAADLVVDGFNGIKIYNDSAESIADAMQKYIESPEMFTMHRKGASEISCSNSSTITTAINSMATFFNKT